MTSMLATEGRTAQTSWTGRDCHLSSTSSSRRESDCLHHPRSPPSSSSRPSCPLQESRARGESLDLSDLRDRLDPRERPGGTAWRGWTESKVHPVTSSSSPPTSEQTKDLTTSFSPSSP